VEGLQHFYWQSGRYREGAAALQAAAEAAESAAPGADDKAACLRVWVRALAWQSSIQRATGQSDAAQRLQQQCLAILQDPALSGADTRLERAILSWCVGATICMADYAQGRERFKKSYSLFRALDHRWGMAWALNAWGTMSKFLGKFQDARQRLEEALALYRALGNPAGIANSLSQLAETASLQGQFEEAEVLAREAVATAREADSRTEFAHAILHLGEVLEKAGKFQEAHAVLLQCLALYSKLGHRNYVTETQSFLGSVEIHQGRYQEARDRVQTSLELTGAHGPPYCVGLNLLLLGSLELAGGAYAMAQQFLKDGIAAYQEVGGHQDDLSWALAQLAIADYGLDDAPGARQRVCHALEMAKESGVVLPLLWALPAMALLLAGEGEIERAVELHALASRYPLVAESRWFADVAGNRIAELSATLPDDQVANLRERGRARDLETTAAQLLTELCE
jgi:tetratricopeptide (TPR) repeat protein